MLTGVFFLPAVAMAHCLCLASLLKSDLAMELPAD
jgi:hypothetical protein